MIDPIYLDNNATTPLDERVSARLIEWIVNEEKHFAANPSSLHHFGQKAKAVLSDARRNIAAFFSVPQSAVIFTSGGSESASLAIRGLLKKVEGAHIITSNVEHPCVFETIQALEDEGAEVTVLPAGERGAVTREMVEAALRPNTKLVVLILANNETGVKLDAAPIGALLKNSRVPFVLDAVAALGKEKIDIPDGVSAVFFSGHKIHGPKGVGMVVLGKGVKLIPQILGGPQEFRMRAGTENLLAIVGLEEAIRILAKEQQEITKKILELRTLFEKGVLTLPHTYLNGSGERICNTSNIAFMGSELDGEGLLIKLDQRGIGASLGSACSSGAIEPSRVLLNMGYDRRRASRSLRFSFGRQNTIEDVQKAVKVIQGLYLPNT